MDDIFEFSGLRGSKWTCHLDILGMENIRSYFTKINSNRMETEKDKGVDKKIEVGSGRPGHRRLWVLACLASACQLQGWSSTWA